MRLFCDTCSVCLHISYAITHTYVCIATKIFLLAIKNDVIMCSCLISQGPTILEGPISIDLLLGSDLTLECIAQNNVDAPNELEFYWYHNDRSITSGSHITINSTGENATRVASSELVVMQVTDDDSGEYQCTVTNRDVVDGVNATSNVTVLCKWPMTQ